MASQYRGQGLAASILISLAATGCGRNPSAPAPGPAPAGPLSLAISGPERVPPGTTARFTASLAFSDGSTQDVTSEASWSSSQPDLLFVTGPGTVEGRGRGEAKLSAVYKTGTARDIMVLEEGTYRLNGWVKEAGTTGYVAQARIETLSPPLVSTISGPDGRYTLYGVATNTELRASKEGYAPLVQRVEVTSHDRLDFSMQFLGSRADFSGRFSLTITAAPECHSALPEEAWRRQYTADSFQLASRLIIELDGANFPPLPSHDERRRYMVGEVHGDRAIINLIGIAEGMYTSIVEQLPDGGYFVPSGTVTLTIANGTITGALDGTLGVWQGVNLAPLASCRSTNHQFVFSPR